MRGNGRRKGRRDNKWEEAERTRAEREAHLDGRERGERSGRGRGWDGESPRPRRPDRLSAT